MNEKKAAVKGSHFDDAEKNNFTLERVGGMENLLEVRDVMEALEPTLQHCPFCGAPAVINGIFAYSLPGAVVRCSQCKCSTEMKLSGQKFPSGKNVTLVVADCSGCTRLESPNFRRYDIDDFSFIPMHCTSC